jgi:hypothetical protein
LTIGRGRTIFWKLFTTDLKVKEPKNLINVKVGDQVAITYTGALAVSVEPAKKKK